MMSATLLLTKAQLVYHSLPFPCHCDVNGFHSFLGFHSADRGTIAGSPGPIFRQMACRKNWASSIKFVGGFRLRELAERVVESQFGDAKRSKSIGFSHGDFRFVV